MAARKTANKIALVKETALPSRTFNMTNQAIMEMQQGLIALSACKSHNYEAILIMARAIVATQKVMKAFEAQRIAITKGVPSQPQPLGPDATAQEQTAYAKTQHEFQTASNAAHAKYTELMHEEVEITLPPILTGSMLLNFQEKPNPLDLVRLDPYMVEL